MIDLLIIQGTTPRYEFNFELKDTKLIKADLIKAMTIIFKQKKSGIEIKRKYSQGAPDNTIAFEDSEAVVRLTQEETLSFVPGLEVGIEMKMLLTDDEVLISDTYRA